MGLRCEKRNITPAPGLWDYDTGACIEESASLAVFQWKRSADDQTLTPGKAVRRFSYRPHTFERALERAEHLCAELESIAHIAHCRDAQVRFRFSSDTTIGSEDLRLLQADQDARVRLNVARHRYTTPEILAALAQDPCSEVRAAVAWNPNTPEELVTQLGTDPIGEVNSAARRALADRQKLSRRLGMGQTTN